MAPCGTTLATFLWVAPEFCFRVLVQHGLTERITHIAMFFPLTLSHYGSRRHSVRAVVPPSVGAHGVTRPTRLRDLVVTVLVLYHHPIELPGEGVDVVAHREGVARGDHVAAECDPVRLVEIRLVLHSINCRRRGLPGQVGDAVSNR